MCAATKAKRAGIVRQPAMTGRLQKNCSFENNPVIQGVFRNFEVLSGHNKVRNQLRTFRAVARLCGGITATQKHTVIRQVDVGSNLASTVKGLQ